MFIQGATFISDSRVVLVLRTRGQSITTWTRRGWVGDQ